MLHQPALDDLFHIRGPECWRYEHNHEGILVWVFCVLCFSFSCWWSSSGGFTTFGRNAGGNGGKKIKSCSNSQFICFLQPKDLLQATERKNRNLLWCSLLAQAIDSNQKPNSIFHRTPPEDASKMQKRMRKVLQVGFVEIICTVQKEVIEDFFPPLFYLFGATASTSGLCNGIQNSDKWLLLQCIGSSLWLCLCPWHLLLETGVHYSLTYNGRVLKHLGHSFSPGRLAKHLDKFYAADILQLGWAFLLPADVYLILCLRLHHSPICCTKHVWLSNLRVTPVLTFASGFVTWI